MFWSKENHKIKLVFLTDNLIAFQSSKINRISVKTVVKKIVNWYFIAPLATDFIVLDLVFRMYPPLCYAVHGFVHAANAFPGLPAPFPSNIESYRNKNILHSDLRYWIQWKTIKLWLLIKMWKFDWHSIDLIANGT